MRATILIAAAAAALAGCSPYQLEGVVVEGPRPGVAVVDASDPRLRRNVIEDAVLQFTLDPERIRPKRLPPAISDTEGRFAVSVEEAGAGLLEYEVSVVARKPGYQATTQTLPLPGNKKRLLIVMTPGRDTYRPAEDIVEETMRLGDEWMRER